MRPTPRLPAGKQNLPPLLEALTDAFANDPTKQVQWGAFLCRNGLTGIPKQFSEVVAVLRKFFEPVLRSHKGYVQEPWFSMAGEFAAAFNPGASYTS